MVLKQKINNFKPNKIKGDKIKETMKNNFIPIALEAAYSNCELDNTRNSIVKSC